ncbi:MAG: AraC family transcriptional regulator [Acinetobacter populi]|uniref:helix-turn-helix domain-containing protein n=1 Tax=Acinetobacter populi TaxID=1582270 RepID=UPI002353D6E2|nr:AraC family transcriptional regulator [Acinetobacter populi]MCH4246646.1 AraC family transcriptional regulator [Acinetobacter populi]
MKTIQDFHQYLLPTSTHSDLNAAQGHFNVFTRSSYVPLPSYRRRDYYKITLIIGSGELHYANRWIKIEQPTLLFSNPNIPYAWQASSTEQAGWFCLFTEKFAHDNTHALVLQEIPFFQTNGQPLLFLEQQQVTNISSIFIKMQEEIQSEYLYKYNVLQQYLYLLIHEAMKIHCTPIFEKQYNAASRIYDLFIELLERQFPVDSPQYDLKFRTAKDFAQCLAIHVNYLNYTVKKITGKTTSQIISTRILQEACVLLKSTRWTISEIAYSLGFDTPAYFTNFFKKYQGISPKNFRLQHI